MNWEAFGIVLTLILGAFFLIAAISQFDDYGNVLFGTIFLGVSAVLLSTGFGFVF